MTKTMQSTITVILLAILALPIFTFYTYAGLEEERMSLMQKRDAKRNARFMKRQEDDNTRMQRRHIADRHNDEKDRQIEDRLVQMELAFDEMMPHMYPGMPPMPYDPMMVPPPAPMPANSIDAIVAKIHRATALVELSRSLKSSTLQAARHRLQDKVRLIKNALDNNTPDAAVYSDGEETDYEDEGDITNDILAMEGGAGYPAPYPGPYPGAYPAPYPGPYPGMYPAGYPAPAPVCAPGCQCPAHTAAPAPAVCPEGCACPLHPAAAPAPAPAPTCPEGCGCPAHTLPA